MVCVSVFIGLFSFHYNLYWPLKFNLIQSWYRADTELLIDVQFCWSKYQHLDQLLVFVCSPGLAQPYLSISQFLISSSHILGYKAQQHQYQRLTEVWWPRKYLDYFKLQLVLQCSVILNYKWFLYWVRSIDKQCTTVINIYVSERMRGGSNEFLVTQDKLHIGPRSEFSLSQWAAYCILKRFFFLS